MSSTRQFPQMDWQQVVLNGGPPCFATLDDKAERFCGRAQRWDGHDYDHKFVSLEDYIQHREQQVRAACAGIADKWAVSHSCSSHDDDPCCHVRTGAMIRDVILGKEKA